jgi:hypothetical protein
VHCDHAKPALVSHHFGIRLWCCSTGIRSIIEPNDLQGVKIQGILFIDSGSDHFALNTFGFLS